MIYMKSTLIYKPKYFCLEELVPKQTFLDEGEAAWRHLHPVALVMLDCFREYIGVGVTINNWLWGGDLQLRGWRPMDCKTGAEFSMHKYGLAFDGTVKGRDAESIRQEILADKNHPLLLPIQRMEVKVPWLHIDAGPICKACGRIYVFGA